MKEAKGSSVFRPTILDQGEYEDGCPDDLSTLVRRCWAEDPNDRPESQYIKNYVKRISKYALSMQQMTSTALHINAATRAFSSNRHDDDDDGAVDSASVTS